MRTASFGTAFWATERVSLTNAGAEQNQGGFYAAISGDGRYVAFVSTGDTLVANDNNGAQDIFVRDRTSGTTTLVSLDSAGTSTPHTQPVRSRYLPMVAS